MQRYTRYDINWLENRLENKLISNISHFNYLRDYIKVIVFLKIFKL